MNVEDIKEKQVETMFIVAIFLFGALFITLILLLNRGKEE
jgi:hypothetical protein